MLQKCISDMLGENTGLTNVIQVMFFRCSLPCQLKASPMWGFNLEEPWTLQDFLGMTHEGMWKLLFKAQKSWPMETEDIGRNTMNPASSVNFQRHT